MNRVKALLLQDDKLNKCFKFDHVWPLMKDTEKFGNDVNTVIPSLHRHSGNFASSQQESPTSASPTSEYLGLSSFCPDISEEDISDTSNQRPIGVKKAKGKQKNYEENTRMIREMREENRQLVNIAKQDHEDRQEQFIIQMLRAQTESKKVNVIEYREENKILFKNLSSIPDPILRESVRNEQMRIIRKRAQQSNESQSSADPFGQ
ncbi:hypothetical protein Fot_32860 [Forsythia ovata]|uniref:No apical meristem-associated C-terminal domain-containing protein n=1 Tax=Forsythia ovata TaxID=205694 RepID=A0ABD1T9J1_9LAMI